MEISNNIRIMRKSLGLTQVQLAEKLNLTQSTIAHYERGSRTIETEKLIHLAEVLECSIDELLGKTKLKELEEKPFVHGNSRRAKLIEIFDKLPEVSQKNIFQLAKGLAGESN
jgi:transcriptional regulator with XRE-family HTH domain